MSVILYVEDHPPAQMLMQAIISEFTSHTLMVAQDRVEALSHVNAHSIDLYILDLDLPDTDGISLASELVEIQSAPVILISAYGEAVNAADLATVNTYIAKPLDPEHVAKVIQRTLA